MAISQPTTITVPWRYLTGANAGPMTATIPQGSTGDYHASYADGFPKATTLPIASGGTPPLAGDFNAVLNQITKFEVWVNCGGGFYFSSAVSAAIGGYSLGAVLMLNNNLSAVISTVANNTQDPNSSMTGWAPYAGALVVSQISSALNAANSHGHFTKSSNTASGSYTVSGGGIGQLGCALQLNPVGSGVFLVIGSGTITMTASGTFSEQLTYGTGTPPTPGSGAAGTVTGTTATHSNGSGSSTQNFSTFSILTLTPGTMYWMDLKASAGSNASLTGTVIAVEIPS